MDSLRQAILDLSISDEVPLAARYKDHALTGDFLGFRSMHVDSAPNPPKDQWVLMYEVHEGEINLVRTGSHQNVYGKS